MPDQHGFTHQIPPLKEEKFQVPRGGYGYIFLSKLQKSGGLLKIPRMIYDSALL